MNACSWTGAALALTALTIAGTAGAQEVASGRLSDSERAAITGVTESYAQAVRSGEIDRIMSHYTYDAIELPPDAPPNEGVDAIRSSWAEFAGMFEDFRLISVEVAGGGDLAYDRGTYALVLQSEEMAEPVTDTGKYVAIMRKRADGSWKISRLIWNADAPVEPHSEEHHH